MPRGAQTDLPAPVARGQRLQDRTAPRGRELEPGVLDEVSDAQTCPGPGQPRGEGAGDGVAFFAAVDVVIPEQDLAGGGKVAESAQDGEVLLMLQD
jgi:hypothetical protein